MNLCILLVLLISVVFPVDADELGKNRTHYIFIHGVKNNTHEDCQEFTKDSRKLYRTAIKYDPFKSLTLKQDVKSTFFCWGSSVSPELTGLNKNLESNFKSSSCSSKLLYNAPLLGSNFLRKEMAYFLYDAFWYQRNENRFNIQEQLWSEINKEENKSNEICSEVEPKNIDKSKDSDYVIFAHSLGATIAFDFLIERYPFLKLKDQQICIVALRELLYINELNKFIKTEAVGRGRVKSKCVKEWLKPASSLCLYNCMKKEYEDLASQDGEIKHLKDDFEENIQLIRTSTELAPPEYIFSLFDSRKKTEEFRPIEVAQEILDRALPETLKRYNDRRLLSKIYSSVELLNEKFY